MNEAFDKHISEAGRIAFAAGYMILGVMVNEEEGAIELFSSPSLPPERLIRLLQQAVSLVAGTISEDDTTDSSQEVIQ